MTERAVEPTTRAYRERLVPGPGLYLALLLLVPAVTLVLIPIVPSAAAVVGVVVYLIIVAIVTLSCPVVRVSGGRLEAGRASIGAEHLGAVELLGSEAMRRAIGPGTDARNYLVVRGWVHRGVRIENTDAADPAPYWVITTRHPQRLADAIEAAR